MFLGDDAEALDRLLVFLLVLMVQAVPVVAVLRELAVRPAFDNIESIAAEGVGDVQSVLGVQIGQNLRRQLLFLRERSARCGVHHQEGYDDQRQQRRNGDQKPLEDICDHGVTRRGP